MKKTVFFIFSLCVLPVGVFAQQETEENRKEVSVSSSGGNWSDSSAWVGGEVPNDVDVVLFQKDSGVLTFDTYTYKGEFEVADDATKAEIDIVAGATLTLHNYIPNNPEPGDNGWKTFEFKGSNPENEFTIKGLGDDSKLVGDESTVGFRGGTFNLDVFTQLHTLIVHDGVLNVQRKDIDGLETGGYSLELSDRYLGEVDSTLRVSSGASVHAGWGIECTFSNSNVVVESGAYLNLDGGILVRYSRSIKDPSVEDMNTLEVYGKVNAVGSTVTTGVISGSGDSENRAVMFVANLVVYSGGELNLTDTQYNGYISRSMKCYGKVSMQKDLCFSDGATLTLGEGSNILTNGAESQEDSYLCIVMRESRKDAGDEGNPNRPYIDNNKNGAASVTLVLESDQKLGGFRFSDGSSLNITLGGHKLLLKSVEMLEGASGGPKIKLNDFAEGLFGVSGENYERFDRNWIEAVYNGDTLTGDELEWRDGHDGYFYLYLATVPEASTVSAILGIFALAFAAWRRRK